MGSDSFFRDTIDVICCYMNQRYCEVDEVLAMSASSHRVAIGRDMILIAQLVGLLSAVSMLVFIVGSVLSRYLLYSITNFTDLLDLSDSALGYVIIPAINCLPDIMNYHVIIESGSTNLVLGQAIGANMISFCIIVGIISIVRPFTSMDRSDLLREYGCVSAALLLLALIVSDGKITKFECALLIAIYPVHLVSLCLEKDQVSQEHIERGNTSANPAENSHLLARRDETSSDLRTTSRTSELWKITNKLLALFSDALDTMLFFCIPISRTSLQKFGATHFEMKLFLLDSELFQLWLTLLSVIMFDMLVFHLRLAVILGEILCFFLMTRLLRIFLSPRYCLLLLDMVAIFDSLLIISEMTKLIVKMLKNLSYLWNISEYSMGLLVFSLVNSMNDIILNILLSMKVSPSLGIKSCMGTCCLLLLIGIGLNELYTMLSMDSESGTSGTRFIAIDLSWEMLLSLYSLIFVVTFTMAYLTVKQWTFDKHLGITLILVWLLTNSGCMVLDVTNSVYNSI